VIAPAATLRLLDGPPPSAGAETLAAHLARLGPRPRYPGGSLTDVIDDAEQVTVADAPVTDAPEAPPSPHRRKPDPDERLHQTLAHHCPGAQDARPRKGGTPRYDADKRRDH